ncbi:DAK2 domain-containing protein [uncultured Anaerococcus sp.]|uniref:DAK2 domain-containing protein n=1 Tax=uncultured Anaerococcus sp. TaxID=293428 RepID=UPI002805878D|nr:DAK2 domain-containing protein [uncultured Anaerococcus sp.]
MKSIDANKLQQMIIGAYEYLDENKDLVNELNVFPVPDGDTGTNMFMTIKSGLDKVNKSGLSSVEEVSKALSQGTLMGARGNSGVILSQLVRGMSKTLKGKDIIYVADVRDIFENASKTAYKAVMQPTEGTILTVANKMAEKANEAFDEDIELDDYLIEIIGAGQVALDNTPNQLPVLKEAGVVDSGGQGLIFLLRGALNALNSNIDRDINLSEEKNDDDFTYKIEFELAGNGANLISLDENLKRITKDYESDLNKDTLKSSFKTDSPQNIVQMILMDGVILKITVENLKPDVENIPESKEVINKKYGFIAVSRGEGYNAIMESMNIDKIIAGGQTMNPSTEDLYKAVEEINAENIFIFPNNKNIIMSAKQAAEVSDKNVFVVETRSIPESFSAILEFDEAVDPEENLENMNEVIEDIHIAEVSISIRDTSVNDIKIRKDDYIGILDGKIVATDSSIEKTCEETIADIIEEDDISLITIYYGEYIEKRRAKDFSKKLAKKFKDVDCELVYGGQPVYYYTITLE